MMYSIALFLLVQASFASECSTEENVWNPGWGDSDSACAAWWTASWGASEDCASCDMDWAKENCGMTCCNMCQDDACVPTMMKQEADGTSVVLKGLSVSRNNLERPGYMFSYVDEQTCTRWIIAVDQDLKYTGSGRTPASMPDWTNSDKWTWADDRGYDGVPALGYDTIKQDPNPSCEFIPADPEVYSGKCNSLRKDEGGFFEVSGKACTVQRSCISISNVNEVDPQLTDVRTANICQATLLKDAQLSLIYAKPDDEESQISYLRGMSFLNQYETGKYSYSTPLSDAPIPTFRSELKQGSYIAWNCGDNCDWQICFRTPPTDTLVPAAECVDFASTQAESTALGSDGCLVQFDAGWNVGEYCGQYNDNSCRDRTMGESYRSCCPQTCGLCAPSSEQAALAKAQEEAALAMKNERLRLTNKALLQVMEELSA